MLYAVGSNPDAARQAGLPAPRLAGRLRRLRRAGRPGRASCSSARSALSTSRPGQGSSWRRSPPPSSAASASLGGSGTVVGAFLGAVLIEMLDQSLVRVEQVSEFWRDAILGALILLAVLLDLASATAPAPRAASRDASRPGEPPHRGIDRARCVTGRSTTAGDSAARRRPRRRRSSSTSPSPRLPQRRQLRQPVRAARSRR